MHRDVLAIVLAGGRGTRLEPLTRDRAKPAVRRRNLPDRRLHPLQLHQLRPEQDPRLDPVQGVSLNRHIDQGWKFLCRELDEYIEVSRPSSGSPSFGIKEPPTRSTRTSNNRKARPAITPILAGDHIYKMNYAKMIDFHREHRADLTMACLPVPGAGAPSSG